MPTLGDKERAVIDCVQRVLNRASSDREWSTPLYKPPFEHVPRDTRNFEDDVHECMTAKGYSADRPIGLVTNQKTPEEAVNIFVGHY
jgi:hypothetical protein